MGIVRIKTRMTKHVIVGGRNRLLERFTDGTEDHSCFVEMQNTMFRKLDSFNCDLRPAHG